MYFFIICVCSGLAVLFCDGGVKNKTPSLQVGGQTGCQCCKNKIEKWLQRDRKIHLRNSFCLLWLSTFFLTWLNFLKLHVRRLFAQNNLFPQIYEAANVSLRKKVPLLRNETKIFWAICWNKGMVVARCWHDSTHKQRGSQSHWGLGKLFFSIVSELLGDCISQFC